MPHRFSYSSIKLSIIASLLLLVHCPQNGSDDSTTESLLPLLLLSSARASTSGLTNLHDGSCLAPNTAPTSGEIAARCQNPSMTNNGNGTVTDSANGIMWTLCGLRVATGLPDDSVVGTSCVALDITTHLYNHAAAVSACNALTYAGHSDWVVPDIVWHRTLHFNRGNSFNVILPMIIGTSGGAYAQFWSASSDPANSNQAYYVDFRNITSTFNRSTEYSYTNGVFLNSVPFFKRLKTQTLFVHCARKI